MDCTASDPRNRRQVRATKHLQVARPRKQRLLAALCVCGLLSAPCAQALAAAGAEPETHRHAKPQILAPGYSALEFTPPEPGSYSLPDLGPAANGMVLDTAGRSVELQGLYGDKVVVLAFIYTRCSDVNGCPLATFVLRQLQDRVKTDPALAQRVRLISLSFDPPFDSPQRLREYSKPFRDPDFDWHFLTTASEAELSPILAAYDQWVIQDIDADGRHVGSLSHLLRVYLIDRQRRIRNIYSVSFLHADTVATDIQTLLQQTGDTAGRR